MRRTYLRGDRSSALVVGRRGRRARQAVAILAIGLVTQVSTRVWAGGNTTTSCVNLCPDLADPCVVRQDVVVVAGSTIDCGSRAVEVSQGSLFVDDGQFVLKARSVLVTGQHVIQGRCPALSGRQGFDLETTDGLTVASGALLDASCDGGGGKILLGTNNGAVTIGGNGVNAKGTAANARGGAISIRAPQGAVTTTARLLANATGGAAPGGRVEIAGRSITLGNDVTVSGSQHAINGAIVLHARGDITVTDPNVASLMASAVTSGQGGIIMMTSEATIRCARPLKARGQGATSTGGTVSLDAEAIEVTNDITAEGGSQGGGIGLRARSGRLDVGLPTAINFEITADGGHGGTGGQIHLTSQGNTLNVYGRVHATDGGSGGDGGSIEVAGADVNSYGGSQIIADGAPQKGGEITIEARGVMSLSGVVHANNGNATFVYRDAGPQVGSGVTGPWTQIQDPDLPAPCGDGVQRAGNEECDDEDLGRDATGEEQTCESLGRGYAGGTLDCCAACTYDTSRCF